MGNLIVTSSLFVLPVVCVYLQNFVELFPVLYHNHIGLAGVSDIMTRLWAISCIYPSRQGTVGGREHSFFLATGCREMSYFANIAPKLAITHSGELNPRTHTPWYSSTPSYNYYYHTLILNTSLQS